MLIPNLPRLSALAFLLACYRPVANCETRLPGILGSHMVLQREKPIHIWGWSAPGEKVAVSLHGISRQTTGDSLGDWSVFLPPEGAGGPYRLEVAGTNKIVLDDVLIGDVWFASGQSNMEMPLKGFDSAPVKDSAVEIARATEPRIRLLHIPAKAADFPLRNGGTGWTVCSPETARDFSAAAYFFGRDLAAREHVPIGLIDATWGGTVAEAWLSLEAISADAGLMPVFATRARMMEEQDEMAAIHAREQREDGGSRDALRHQGRDLVSRRVQQPSGLCAHVRPTVSSAHRGLACAVA
jgi:sialate O-acetylesterase